MNPNTLQTVKIFLLMFLMLIFITSQTVLSQTLHSSLHNHTASQQIDGAESGKVFLGLWLFVFVWVLGFFSPIPTYHTILIMFGPKLKAGVNSQLC